MIGVDANILLRFILRDDAEQFDVVNRRFRLGVERNEVLHVGPVALVETIWTLRAITKVPKDQILATLTAILETPPLRVFDETVVLGAMSAYADSKADFADCLTRQMDKVAGCYTTISFDKAALQTPGFAHPSAA